MKSIRKPSGCRLREHDVNGFRAVTIENAFLAATILPEKGADIYSLVCRRTGVDVLWKSPWKPHHPLPAASAGASESAWFDQYAGGWQDIFPNGGDACIYRGAALGFHGEACVSGWDYTVHRGRGAGVAVEMCVELRRSPFRLRRVLSVEPTLPALLIGETIENLGEEDLHYMWGQHPAFGAPFLDAGCRLRIPANRYVAHDVEISPHSRITTGASGHWPVVDGKVGTRVDLSVLPPREQRVTEFGYIGELSEGWYALTNNQLNLSFGLAWPKDIFPHVWFWQELRGSFGYPWYGRSYVMAVEPFTSVPGVGLEKAIEHGSAPVLKAGASIEARFAAVLFDACEVDSIGVDGVTRGSVRHDGR